MKNHELIKNNLEWITYKMKESETYDTLQFNKDLIHLMKLNTTNIEEELETYIQKELQNFEDEEIKKDELIEILSEIITNKYIVLIDSRKLVMDFEWFDNSTFCEELEEEIKESYDYKIIEDINKYAKTIIFYGVQKKINEILEEIAKNIENVKIKDIIEYLK
ncbi:hypothetical protein [Streptobacillus moniliformis]|uniref:hypothetical protein n=1 Tax=Streptobacillus moniliformis TaxID=34105 RepID=UPI0007E48A1C|nr:hypothetical protein [Streptobacillus moniliformis]